MSQRISILHSLLLLCLTLFLISSCKNDSTTGSDEDQQLVIRLSSEPESLSPMTSVKNIEKEVHEYLFISLADYHPVTMDLIPVLLESIPIATPGNDTDSKAYTMRIKEDAEWSNGSPITAYDLLWTLKMANHPGVVAPGWKQLLQDIKSIDINTANPKECTMNISGDYFLTFEALLSAEIYPAYRYDSMDIMKGYSLEEMAVDGFESSDRAKDPVFLALAKDFSSAKYKQEIVEGAGPYQLEKWETGQYISIKQKPKYWGDNYPDNPFLKSNPDRIIFQIIPDNNVALTLLKSDEIDFMDMGALPYIAYNELAENPVDDDITTHINSVPRVYSIIVNNEDPRLSQKEVRLALNACLDRDRIINQIEGGFGEKTNSIIPSNRVQYNKNLPSVDYNISSAQQLLSEAGWTDNDGDGIREKIINGKLEKLSFRFFNSGSALGAGISSILAEGAKEVGIEIIDTKKSYRDTRRENLLPGDFELVAAAATISESRQDPYLNWHSASMGNAGSNYSRYSNARADEQMEIIRSTPSDKAQLEAYYKLQEIMLEDAPLIFLYMPQGRLAIDDDITPMLSEKRPGYFANAFIFQ